MKITSEKVVVYVALARTASGEVIPFAYTNPNAMGATLREKCVVVECEVVENP